MNIPTKVRIVRREYRVRRVTKLPRRLVGYADYHERILWLAEHNSHRRHTPAEMRDTFWHEVTHAILNELEEYRLRDNERFVSRFATALSKMIDSARFK